MFCSERSEVFASRRTRWRLPLPEVARGAAQPAPSGRAARAVFRRREGGSGAENSLQ